MVEMDELQLVAVVAHCLSRPRVRLRSPPRAVVAEHYANRGDIAIDDEGACLGDVRLEPLVQSDPPLRVEQHLDGLDGSLHACLREIGGPAQVFDLVLALKQRYGEAIGVHVAYVHSVDAGVVASFGQQLGALFES